MAQRGRNRRSLDAAVKVWRDTGRLGDVDEVLVTTARALADLIDSPAAKFDAAMWRQYRQALTDLREAARDDDGDDLSRLLDSLSSDVGDAATS